MAKHPTYITSYDDLHSQMQRLRKPDNGMKWRTFARIFRLKDEPGYMVTIHGTPVCTITPDDVVTFVIGGDDIQSIKNTLSYGLGLILPFYAWRISTGRYALVPQGTSWRTFHEDKKKYPCIYPGLKIDLRTRNPISSQEDDPYQRTADPEARRQWLANLRRFRRTVLARQRVGAIDAILAQEPKYTTALAYERALEVALTDDHIPHDLFTHIVWHNYHLLRYKWYYRHTGVTGQAVANSILSTLKNRSTVLRETFGVLPARSTLASLEVSYVDERTKR